MRYSSSILDRAEKCPASLVLPQVREPAGANAEFGTVVHKYLEDCLNEGQEKALAAVPDEHQQFCRGIPVEELPLGEGARAEVSFCYDPSKDEAREIVSYNRDEYSDTECIYGTADLIRVSGRKGLVADYKTGKGNKLQLRFLALCLARTYDLESVTASTIYVKADGVFIDSEELDADDLHSTVKRLKAMQAAVSHAAGEAVAGNVSVNAGEHCRFCPAFRACPAQTAMVSKLGGIEERVENFAIVSPEQAGKAWARLKQIKAALARVEDSLTRYAFYEGEFPLPDGGKVKVIESEKEYVTDARGAMEVVGQYDIETATEAVSYSTTKSAIKSAAYALWKAGKLEAKSRAEAERVLLEEIRARKAITVKTSKSIREVRDE